MPFIPHTPESLLPHSDNKNPATTCRGITSSGRPCRRALASPSNSPSRNGRVLTPDGHSAPAEDAEALFCWQHKDQAGKLVAAAARLESIEERQLRPRTSIDTLVERLGVLSVRPAKQQRKKGGSRDDVRAGSRRPNRTAPGGKKESSFGDARPSSKKKAERGSGLAWFCCLTAVPEREEDELPASRAQRGSEAYQPGALVSSKTPRGHASNASAPSLFPEMSTVSSTTPPFGLSASGPQKTVARKPLSPIKDPPSSASPGRSGAASLSPTPSRTPTLLSQIPSNLTPATTISPLDRAVQAHLVVRRRRIHLHLLANTYISWLPGHDRQSNHALRKSSKAAALSELVQEEPRPRSGNSPARKTGRRTILLKIGRANNVHRRMNEWTRQCDYDLQLVRWYPYLSSSSPSPSPLPSPARSAGPRRPSSTSSSSQAPRKVPHAHKVERLIHIELAERRVKSGECKACGRMHREWFEVEATEEGVRGVDEVVKRWVAWAENRAGLQV